MEAPYAAYHNGRQPCNTVLAPQFFGPKKGFGVASGLGHPLKFVKYTYLYINLRREGLVPSYTKI
jgi:hypothetical protein